MIFITHNPHHAYPVGDHFFLLNRGKMIEDWTRQEVTLDALVRAMAGGAEPRRSPTSSRTSRGGKHAAREQIDDLQSGPSCTATQRDAGFGVVETDARPPVRIGVIGTGRIGRMHAQLLAVRSPAPPSRPCRRRPRGR